MTIQDNLVLNSTSIINRYQSGESIKSIADSFNCNSGMVWYFLDGKNLIKPRRSKNYGKADELYLEKIKILFLEDKSAYKIGKELGVPTSLVIRVMKRNGFSTSHKSKQREVPLGQFADKIAQDYIDGKSMCKIAKEYNCSDVSILNILKYKNVERRDIAIYSQDETFFDKIDTEAKAYILGWFYSDGNNIKGNAGIRLQITDLDILERIKEEMKCTGKIHYSHDGNPKHKPIHNFQINSKTLSLALEKLGCPPNKTFLIKYPSEDIIPKHLTRHFARGYFDGDGSIGKNSGERKTWKIQITGTRNLLEGLAKHSGVVGYFHQRFPERNNDNWSWQVYKLSEYPILANWLYEGQTICLERKRLIYQESLAHQPSPA